MTPDQILQAAIRRAKYRDIRITRPERRKPPQPRPYQPTPIIKKPREWPRIPMPLHTVGMIAGVVAEHHGLALEELRGDGRRQHIALPRQIAQYLASTMTGKSSPDIGRYFYRDHSTVLHAIAKIERLLVDDEELRARISVLRAEIEQRREVISVGEVRTSDAQGIQPPRPEGVGDQAPEGEGSEPSQNPTCITTLSS